MIVFIRFLNLIMAGLIAGSIAGISLGYNPASFSYPTYVEYQQNAIASLNTIMPILGLITIILTLVSAFSQKTKKSVLITLLVAATLLIAAGLITRFGNQPINAEVMKWSPSNTPANWSELRADWWQFHLGRTVLSVIAFCLIAWTSVRK
jgi:hypothetical protein